MSDVSSIKLSVHECGSDSISDWAILNDTKPKQLHRIFKEVYAQTDIEVALACCLLEGYHSVYRRDLMRLRIQGQRGKHPLPTAEQLQQIACYLQVKTHQSCSPQQIMQDLEAIARKLRYFCQR